MKPDFKKYASQILKNAKRLSEKLIEYGFTLITGGTDNHLMLVDLTNKNITGKQAEEALGKAKITVNKNTIPWDSRKPYDPSRIRIGTPAITTRGLIEKDMDIVAEFINEAINSYHNEDKLKKIGNQVTEFISPFQIPGIE